MQQLSCVEELALEGHKDATGLEGWLFKAAVPLGSPDAEKAGVTQRAGLGAASINLLPLESCAAVSTASWRRDYPPVCARITAST